MNTTEVSLAVFCWCVYGLGAIGIMEIDRIYPRPSNPRVWWHLVIAFIGGPLAILWILGMHVVQSWKKR